MIPNGIPRATVLSRICQTTIAPRKIATGRTVRLSSPSRKRSRVEATTLTPRSFIRTQLWVDRRFGLRPFALAVAFPAAGLQVGAVVAVPTLLLRRPVDLARVVHRRVVALVRPRAVRALLSP